MINPKQLRDLVVIPVCHAITPDRDIVPAVELLMRTAMQESELVALAQYGGPALGLWQMEPATFKVVIDWSRANPGRGRFIDTVMTYSTARPAAPEQLCGNLYLSCVMARLLYMSIPTALPQAGDLEGQWLYYKAHYNSWEGTATRDQFMAAAEKLRKALL